MSLRCWCFWRLSRNVLTINATTHTFLERSSRDLSGNVWVVAAIVYRFRDNRQNRLTINATTHTFSERSFRDLSENVWVVALIIYRFPDKWKKKQLRRLNSYGGDYSHWKMVWKLKCLNWKYHFPSIPKCKRKCIDT